MTNTKKRLIKRYFRSTGSNPEGLLPSILKRTPKHLLGEVRLFVAMFESAVLNEDLDFINGVKFKEYCTLLGLKHKAIKKACLLLVEL